MGILKWTEAVRGLTVAVVWYQFKLLEAGGGAGDGDAGLAAGATGLLGKNSPALTTPSVARSQGFAHVECNPLPVCVRSRCPASG